MMADSVMEVEVGIRVDILSLVCVFFLWFLCDCGGCGGRRRRVDDDATTLI